MSILIGRGRRAVRATDSVNAWKHRRKRGPPNIRLAMRASPLTASIVIHFIILPAEAMTDDGNSVVSVNCVIASTGNNTPRTAPTRSHVLYVLDEASDDPNGFFIRSGTCPLDGNDGMFTIG